MSTGTLNYFPAHGKAGPIRMLLTHKGIEWEDRLIQMEEWATVKPTMPGGNVPCWQPAGTELKLGQAYAILRMMGKEYGYLAETPEAIYKQEFAIECFNDYNAKKNYMFMMGPEISEENQKIWDETIGTLWGKIEKLLAQGDSKFVAGDKMTVADFVLFSFASTYYENATVKHQCLHDSFAACIEKH